MDDFHVSYWLHISRLEWLFNLERQSHFALNTNGLLYLNKQGEKTRNSEQSSSLNGKFRKRCREPFYLWHLWNGNSLDPIWDPYSIKIHRKYLFIYSCRYSNIRCYFSRLSNRKIETDVWHSLILYPKIWAFGNFGSHKKNLWSYPKLKSLWISWSNTGSAGWPQNLTN